MVSIMDRNGLLYIIFTMIFTIIVAIMVKIMVACNNGCNNGCKLCIIQNWHESFWLIFKHYLRSFNILCTVRVLVFRFIVSDTLFGTKSRERYIQIDFKLIPHRFNPKMAEKR